MKRYIQPCIGAAALALSLSAAAQITQYGQEDLRGRAYTFDESVPDLAATRFDDRASSVMVRSGTWQLCTEAFYRGTCVTVGPGEYSTLRTAGVGNRVSSLREITPPGRAPVAANRGIVLFEQPNFAGASVRIDGYADSLDRFNDRARSMIIYDGEWQLCQHDRFRGDCMVFREGQHANLGPLSGDVSSVRPLSATPPPVATPGPGHGQVAGWGSGARAVLYEGENFRGRTMTVVEDLVANLRDAGFDDRASSLRVEGGAWVLCSDPNFQGQCWTFGPGEYPVLPRALTDRLSSARRVHDDNPGDRRFRDGRR